MFQKTRLRLTIQNSFILILVISAIATAVYSYMQFLLYSDLDEDLKLLMTEYEEIVECVYRGDIENGYMQELGEHEEEYVPNFNCE